MKRTERQQRQADSYKAHAVVAILPANAGIPANSWWTSCSREEFHDRQAKEQSRIVVSKFGRQLVVVD